MERVIDGDTVVLFVDLGFNVHLREKFRLAGINAPELRTAEGKDSKQALENLILGKDIYVRVYKKGKYGRWIAELITEDGLNVNCWLLENGYAVEY